MTTLVTNTEIRDKLRDAIPSDWNVPIYDEYPAAAENVRYGLYVEDVYNATRDLFQNGVQYCGAIYTKVDTFDVIYVSFQNDPYENPVADIVSNLPTISNDDGTPLFDGYFERTFTHDVIEGPTRASIHTWSFDLTRLDFNT